MKIRLIWVGKTKEPFLHEGIRKYLKLLKPYVDISVTEIKEERGKDIRRNLEKEGERILKLNTPFTLMDEKGTTLSSVEFSEFIRKQGSDMGFVLGGAYGVSDTVKESSRKSIALSRMTLTHEMSRVIFLEQVFRAFTIIHKRSYHH